MPSKPIVLKSMQLLTIAFPLFSGCATVWDEQGFSRPEQQEWKQLGYGDDDSSRANEWRRIGATAKDANNLERDGFKIEVAIEWKKNGFELNDAHAWWKYNFKPQDALKWKENGFELNDAHAWWKYSFKPQDALKWKRNGFEIETANKWQAGGFSTEEAIDFQKLGLNPHQASEFKELGFQVTEVREWFKTKLFPSKSLSDGDFLDRIRNLKSLAGMNVTPATVLSWQADGANTDEILQNAKWVSRSLTFPQFKIWSKAGFDSESAYQAIQKGMTIQNAKAHLAERQKIEARIKVLERQISENEIGLTRMKEDQTCIQVSFHVISKLAKGRYEVELLTAGYAHFAPGARYLLSTQITQFTSRGRSASFVKWGSPVTADTVDGFKKTVRTLSEVPKCVNAANKIIEANEKILWERQALQCLSDSNNVSDVPKCVSSAKKKVETLFGLSRP
jgi:DNA-nicking Smr family endonuclease